MPNGIIIVNKPAGWTSQDVAAKLRGVFHEKRVGHGGTLDPMATGVLPVFVGRATRAVEFFEHADKEYIATLRLGTVTDTQDTTGTVLETRPVCVTAQELDAVLTEFTGELSQLPPMYSAVKIHGQKLYTLARQGKQIERTPRRIRIFALERLSSEGAEHRLRIHCSKGTYVRTLCADIGARLGCGGCMAALERTRAGAFSLSQAHTVEELLRTDDPEKLLLPVDTLFADAPALTARPAAEKKLRNGAQLKISGIPDGFFRVYAESGEFLLYGKASGGILSTVKSFFEVN